MPTVTTASEPYCTPTQLLNFADWRVVGDYASDGFGPPPTRCSLLDETDETGGRVISALLSASGEVEAACLRGGRYSVEDLEALTGSTANYLQSIVAGIAIWKLASRRAPVAADPNKIPGVKSALDALESLRVGEQVFGLVDQIDAGKGPRKVTIMRDDDDQRAVVRARAYFGNRERG